MSDPTRLRKGGSGLEVSLLDAAIEADLPPVDLEGRTFVRLGLLTAAASIFGAASGSASGSAAAGSGATASSAGATIAGATAVAAGKLLGIGFVAGMLVGGGAAAIILDGRSHSALPSSSVVAEPARLRESVQSMVDVAHAGMVASARGPSTLVDEVAVQRDLVEAPGPGQEPALPNLVGQTSARSVEAPKAAPAPSGEMPSTPVSAEGAGLRPRSALAEERTYVDRAWSALRRGDCARAHMEAEGYRAHYDHGVLGEDVGRILIEARLRCGDRNAAVAEARLFLARYPASLYVRDVRVILGEPAIE